MTGDTVILNAKSVCGAPEWLDKLFVHRCLQNYYPEKQIQIHSFDVKPGTAKGENYASYIYRITVVFTDSKNDTENNFKSKNVIVKLALDDGSFAVQKLSALNVYEKEMEMYDKILPRMKILLNKTNYKQKIFANTYLVSKSNQAIAFEDLTVKGYKMRTSKDGFDIVHTKMVLSKLAKFHAAAAVLQEVQPSIFKNFQNGMMNRSNEGINIMYQTELDALIETVDGWKNFEYYADKLRKLRPNLIEKGRKAFDPSPNHFNTLIHGDIWTNNIMLSYDESNQLENVALIDFQFCVWTSPAVDLQYFFNTSLAEDLRLYHQEELVQYYHKKLSITLKRLNYQKHVPTLHEFQVQFLEKTFYGFTSGCLVQPVMLNEHTDDADIEALLGTDERARAFKRLTLKSAKVQKNIQNLLPVFDRKGMFD